MIFEVLTIFPEIIENYVGCSMMKRASQCGAVQFNVRNIRDYALDKHHVTDDMPFGGGPGMVMKPEPVAGAIEAAKSANRHTELPVVYLSPQGERWNQQMARDFSKLPGMLLLCGRYEGLDERAIEKYVDREFSVGDYVLTGGELGALIMIDSITRLVPGVLGNDDSAIQDSFSEEGLLDCPHYTRPENWNGIRVPEVLLSGHHANIDAWRRQMSLSRTRDRRPDLFKEIEPGLSKKDRKLLDSLEK
jgi:tRNA (guanine37-N1)-methyltransferase